METGQRKTLREIFVNPVKNTVLWSDIENLFVTLGATLEEGHGSGVCIMLNGIIAVFHRPHPKKETDRGALKSVRHFLKNSGVKNDDI